VPEHLQNDLFVPAKIAIEEGRLADALSLLRSLADQNPGIAEIYQLAGECLLNVGDVPAAQDAFRRAVSLRPDWPSPYIGAAQAHARAGDAFSSMQVLLHVLAMAPRHRRATAELRDLLAQLHPHTYLPDLEPALHACFSHPEVDPTPLAKLCAGQLSFKYGGAGGSDEEELAQLVSRGDTDTELLRLYLSRVVNCDPRLEKWLTRLRRYLCLNIDIVDPDKAPEKLLAALAQQCFLNEYVFASTDEESLRVAEAEGFLDRMTDVSGRAALAFALACCYRAPAADTAGEAFAAEIGGNFPWLDDLCRVSVFEPAEEARLEPGIPVLRPVADECSLAVQAQYEVNSYPRWQGTPAPERSPIVRNIRRRFSQHQDVGSLSGQGRVLVAGCGTGYEPIDIALRDDDLAVTAVDLSRKSLAYAKRKAQAAGCGNIEFVQADILDLPATGIEFDLIICTGVLHHMANPLAGWKVLRDLLTRHGMMRISVYSAYARRFVRAARERFEADRGSVDPDRIREVRRLMLEQGQAPEFVPLLTSDDFYSMSGCRDLLFHVQEHQFTLPQVAEALARLDLRFCGFDPPDTSLLRDFSRAHPGRDALLDLQSWDRFEQANPDIFAGMYQFWCEPC